MWVVPTDLVIQRVLFYAVDKADYQLILFLTKQLDEDKETWRLTSTLLRSSYSIVEAVFAGPLALAVRKAMLRGSACYFVILCALLGVSYGGLAFVRGNAAILVLRFFQAALLLGDSLTLTQVTQAIQPQNHKRSASNQTEIVLNATAMAVQIGLFFFQKCSVSIQHQFLGCASICAI